MRVSHAVLRSTVAAIAALSADAQAVEIDQLLGRWSGPAYDECAYADDSEGAPLQVWREDDEIVIGSFGWRCSVPAASWEVNGDFLVATAKNCGPKGGSSSIEAILELGLSEKGELLMGKGTTVGLRRCAVQQ